MKERTTDQLIELVGKLSESKLYEILDGLHCRYGIKVNDSNPDYDDYLDAIRKTVVMKFGYMGHRLYNIVMDDWYTEIDQWVSRLIRFEKDEFLGVG